MMWFVFSLGLLLFCFFILHLRWERKKRNFIREIKEKEAHLIQNEKMGTLGVLCAGIAHEINNPLSYLITNLNFLLNFVGKNGELAKNSSEEISVIVEECLSGAYRIKRIVQDFLLFSHRTQGKRKLTDVNELLDSVVRILWNEIKYRVGVIKDYQLKSKIWVDSTELGQVFLNIILNAFEAIGDRGVVKIFTFEDEENLYIKISDTGKGIRPELFSKIFNPFFTTKGKIGLGLYISKSIVEKYKGRIDVESISKKGSSFIVSLPKKEVKDEREI